MEGAERSHRTPAWSFEHSVETPASHDAVWGLWEDFSERHDWDALEWARLEGPLAAGAEGRWKPSNAPKMRVWIERVEPGKSFTLAATHWRRAAVLRYKHELEPTSEGKTKITHRMELEGPLARLIARAAGPGWARDLPEAMSRLADLAEQRGQRNSEGSPSASPIGGTTSGT